MIWLGSCSSVKGDEEPKMGETKESRVETNVSRFEGGSRMLGVTNDGYLCVCNVPLTNGRNGPREAVFDVDWADS